MWPFVFASAAPVQFFLLHFYLVILLEVFPPTVCSVLLAESAASLFAGVVSSRVVSSRVGRPFWPQNSTLRRNDEKLID